MVIVEKKLSELKPYEKNPRKNEKAVKAVANSIKEFGFKVPIVIDKNGVIVAGHTRYKASKELGLKTVPCIVADDLTEEQIKAFRIADNKTNELAEWDLSLLNLELADLPTFEFSDFGFNEAELLSIELDYAPAQEVEYEAGNYDDDEDDEFFRDALTRLENRNTIEPSEEEIKAYDERRNETLAKRVILVYHTDEEMEMVKALLGVKPEENLNVVYTIEQVKANLSEKSN